MYNFKDQYLQSVIRKRPLKDNKLCFNCLFVSSTSIKVLRREYYVQTLLSLRLTGSQESRSDDFVRKATIKNFILAKIRWYRTFKVYTALLSLQYYRTVLYIWY